MKITVVQHPAGTVRIIEGEFGRIVQKADENCARCDTDAYVPHYNCLYNGNAVGHSAAHCTANACY